jgi:hypothetical protein
MDMIVVAGTAEDQTEGALLEIQETFDEVEGAAAGDEGVAVQSIDQRIWKKSYPLTSEKERTHSGTRGRRVMRM